MAQAMISGLINNKDTSRAFSPSDIHVFEPNPDCARVLVEKFKVNVVPSNEDAVKNADVVIFAVKPQIMNPVATQLASIVQQFKPLIISIAAGIKIDDLNTWLGGNVAVVRTMPNTPALIGQGATGMFANTHVSSAQKELADRIIQSISAKMYLIF